MQMPREFVTIGLEIFVQIVEDRKVEERTRYETNHDICWSMLIVSSISSVPLTKIEKLHKLLAIDFDVSSS